MTTKLERGRVWLEGREPDLQLVAGWWAVGLLADFEPVEVVDSLALALGLACQTELAVADP